MSDLLKKAQRLKSEYERDRREADKAQGALDSLLAQLKKDHNISTLEEIDKLIIKLKKEKSKIEEEIEEVLNQISQECESKL